MDDNDFDDDHFTDFINPLALQGSVGPDQANSGTDLQRIRHLLKKFGHGYLKKSNLTTNNTALFIGIELYQMKSGTPPTGIVRKGDATHKEMGRDYHNIQMGCQLMHWPIYPKMTKEDATKLIEKWQRWELRAQEKGWEGLKPGQGSIEHHHRNLFMKCPKKEEEVKVSSDWLSEGEMWTHCGYNSYRGQTGTKFEGYQCVFDEGGDLVTLRACMGTYDYHPPYDENGNSDPIRFAKHFLADIWDWIVHGN